MEIYIYLNISMLVTLHLYKRVGHNKTRYYLIMFRIQNDVQLYVYAHSIKHPSHLFENEHFFLFVRHVTFV